jgi:DEAD/DEAH box helicase domain-containing protein
VHDPLGAFTELRDHYIAYLDTAFRIDDRELADERRRLLRSAGELTTDPYLGLRRFPWVGCRADRRLSVG